MGMVPAWFSSVRAWAGMHHSNEWVVEETDHRIRQEARECSRVKYGLS